MSSSIFRKSRPAMLLLAVLSCVACGSDDGPQRATVDATGVWPVDTPAAHSCNEAELLAVGDWLESESSLSFIVVHDGDVIHEQYWRDRDADSIAPMFSVTKSFSSVAVGMAEQQGLLSLGEAAARYIDDWVGTDSEPLAVRQLLTGDSGRTWDFVGDFPGLSGFVPPDDLTQYAIDRGQHFEPGTTWQYNQMAIQCLERVLSVATGQTAEAFTREMLMDRLGMRGAVIGTDGAGQMTMAYGISARARDMARFGYLLLNRGRWNGEQLLSADFVDAATSQANPINANYGYLIWLNPDGDWYEPVTLAYHESGRVYPDAPPDVFVASGFLGQLVLVSPSENLIIVRQGTAAPPGSGPTFFNEIYRRVAAAQYP